LDDIPLPSILHGTSDGSGDGHGFVSVQRSGANPIGEAATFCVLHHAEEAAIWRVT